MKTAANLALVGPMGAGKSVVGRALAGRLGLAFVDLDVAIEQAAGASVAAIFERDGEATFREREHAVLEEVLARDGQVVATGGGAVLDSRNRELLHGRAYVAWLAAGVDIQLQRLEGCTDRPLMRVPDPRDRLEALKAERDGKYALVADLRLDTDGLSIEAVADALEDMLRKSWARAGAAA